MRLNNPIGRYLSAAARASLFRLKNASGCMKQALNRVGNRAPAADITALGYEHEIYIYDMKIIARAIIGVNPPRTCGIHRPGDVALTTFRRQMTIHED